MYIYIQNGSKRPKSIPISSHLFQIFDFKAILTFLDLWPSNFSLNKTIVRYVVQRGKKEKEKKEKGFTWKRK